MLFEWPHFHVGDILIVETKIEKFPERIDSYEARVLEIKKIGGKILTIHFDNGSKRPYVFRNGEGVYQLSNISDAIELQDIIVKVSVVSR